VADLSLITGSVVGATAGFLIYNRPPASIFMGDGGSTTLGFALAYMTLRFSRADRGKPGPLMFSFLVAALPLFDALLAVIRRLRAGKSAFSGDRGHSYDIAAARGWTARRIIVASYAITAFLGGIGWIGLRIQPRGFAILTAFIFAVLFAIALRFGSLRAEIKSADQTKCGQIAPAVSAAPGAALTQLGILVESEEIETI
jgi:UDP-GlcNAc:undecaprenyl-phosphate/decaprenyl-phosphate GlcNAc-1-phosphate transferase